MFCYRLSKTWQAFKTCQVYVDSTLSSFLIFIMMRIMKGLSVLVTGLFIIFGCRHSPYEFNSSVKDFEDNTKGISGYYFYPGTIKMLNIKKDSAFTNLFKDVKRIKVLSFSKSEKDSIDPKNVQKLIAKIRKDGFENMMQMKQDKQQLLLFIRHEKGLPHQIGINITEKDLYVVEILGSLRMSFLMNFLKKENSFEGFNTVLNLNKLSKPESPKKDHGNNPRN